jgi:hypothetical protein
MIVEMQESVDDDDDKEDGETGPEGNRREQQSRAP